ncbi:MAG TPA: hypothetical protein VL098_12225 [Flavipsychrobacter sp.]|nr:hypothetical protein [Flavipsychrobacter sp.]
MFRICKNPTTEWLRKTYRAVPLRIPEKRYQPLRILSYDGDEVTYLGELKYLLTGGHALNVDLQSSPMADASLEKTKSMSFDVGFSILNGFFKALKMEPVAISAAFSGVRELSFSFNKVNREYIDILQLGSILASNPIHIKNPALDIFRNNEDMKMLLLTDAITSKGFSINDHTKGNHELNIDIPLIEKYIADGDLKVKLGSDQKYAVSFEGEEAVTFAFACAVVEPNWDTGLLSVKELFNPRDAALEAKGVDSKDMNQNQLNYKMLLDDDENEPAMIGIS